MAEGKRGFKIYADWKNWLAILTQEQKAQWVDWLFDYVNDLHPEMPKDQALLMACNMTRNALKIDLDNYYKKIEAGKKGGIATQLKQKQAKSSKVKQNEAQPSTLKQSQAKSSDMIRKDIDMICKDKICNDISLIEEENIDKLQDLIQAIEEMFNRCLTNAEAITIKEFSKTMSNESIIRDLTLYSDKQNPIAYMKKMIENAKIQEQVKPNNNEGTPQQPQLTKITCWMDAFKIAHDETYPQQLRDEAKQYLEKH